MKKIRSEAVLISTLLAVGAVMYALRWALFPGQLLHNEMWRFLLGDVAFLFLQIAFVSLFIDRLLRERERRTLLNKLNMVIGAFFSETGNNLLRLFVGFDSGAEGIAGGLIPDARWTRADYAKAGRALKAHTPQIDLTHCDLRELGTTLRSAKPFMLGLLGNQALLEHEVFTDVLWALTHLAEELDARPILEDLPESDVAHLTNDARRAYRLLTIQWLEHLAHLQERYPYLFSLEVRRNPFDSSAQVIVAE